MSSFNEYEEYDIDIDLVQIFTRYSGCGTHMLNTRLTIDGSQVKELHEKLSKILEGSTQ